MPLAPQLRPWNFKADDGGVDMAVAEDAIYKSQLAIFRGRGLDDADDKAACMTAKMVSHTASWSL